MNTKSANKSFIIRDNVPILDEHVLFDDHGREIARISYSVLEQIARNNNRKIDETGDEVPIIIGHTKDGQSEDEQPEIVGYADKFRVARLFSTKRKAIYVRFKIFKDKEEVLRRFPRRSVELWLRKKEIDPISLLGASTPERSLGLLRLSRQDGLHYTREIEKYAMNPDEMVQQLLAALQQTEQWKFLTALMEQESQAGQQMEEGPGQGAGEQEPPPEHNQGYDEGPPDQERVPPQEHYMMEDQPDQYAGAGYASGTNTFTPHYEASMETPASVRSSEANHQARDLVGRDQNYNQAQARGLTNVRMGRGQRDPEVIRLQRLASDQGTELRGLRIRLQASEREKDLIQLQNEGYLFDLGEEVNRVCDMPDEDYEDHIGLIRARYQRDMTAGAAQEVVRFSRTAQTGTARPTDRQTAMKRAETALRQGKAYEDVEMGHEADRVF